MNSRERVIAAITGQGPDRLPLDGYFRQDVWASLRAYLGAADDEQLAERLGLDLRYAVVEPAADFAERAAPSPWQIPDIGVGRQNLAILHDNNWLEDDYGVCRTPNSSGLYWGYTYHPVADAGIAEIMRYRFPDAVAPERYQGVREDVARWRERYFVVVELWNVFKSSWELRGFERYMQDLSLEPRLVETLADRVLEYRVAQSKALARCGVDMIQISGDVAMQNGMMLSPRMWRRYFKPRLRAWLAEVRREHDIRFMFHSDGDMTAIFEDLIEIGFDIVDPIQPECMDVAGIQDRYRGRICLHGSISCQRTLPFGSPEDVAAEVRQRIAGAGREGGLIVAPSNTLQPDVPMKNILALYDTVKGSRNSD
jgi:uroporphyrinogen decarboxylase